MKNWPEGWGNDPTDEAKELYRRRNHAEWHAENGNLTGNRRGTLRYKNEVKTDSKGKRLCRFVQNGDTCPYGESCHFSHEPSREESEKGKRMLLAGFKRLREERREKEENKKQKQIEGAESSELFELLMSTVGQV